MKNIKRLLVVNRGDIAVRIFRACRLENITPVTVFSEQDKYNLHVRLADEAYSLGSGDIYSTYMNIDKIMKAAFDLKVDAIHPGYAFLAKNSIFAEKVLDEGYIWVGPKPKVLAKLGNKLVARKIAKSVGFNIIPGSENLVESIEEAESLGRELGYPLIIKPIYGGGGSGIVFVKNEKELKNNLEMAKANTKSAGIPEEMYIEKYIDNSKQIEFDFIVDADRSVICLPEREVTIQQNYQKLVSESPSTFLTEEKRRSLIALTTKLVKFVNYENIGSIQLHYKEGMDFLFDEINTHIQLEHPLTEMVSGIDLVAEQLNIAQANPLRYNQREININGYAMEFRINAEDPLENFHPYSGIVKELDIPGGPWLRFDTNVYRGYKIPLLYNTYLGQLLVWGNTRETARKRAVIAMNELSLAGVPTTIGFHRHLLNHPTFKDGSFTSNFIEKSGILINIQEEYRATVAALFAIRKQTSKVILPPLSKSRWRDSARKDATGRSA